MDEYRPRASKIIKGLIFLLLSVFVLWFTVQSFPAISPFYDGSGYTLAEITELPSAPDGTVIQVRARYWVGFKKIEGRFPADIFYWDGLEVGDKIHVPCRNISFDNMNGDEKKWMAFFIGLAGIFLISAVTAFAKEIGAARYFRRLILNKLYVEAEFVKSIQKFGRSSAVCAYDKHIFISKYYKWDKYPFKRGGKIRVYVDLDKNPDKYLVSER